MAGGRVARLKMCSSGTITASPSFFRAALDDITITVTDSDLNADPLTQEEARSFNFCQNRCALLAVMFYFAGLSCECVNDTKKILTELPRHTFFHMDGIKSYASSGTDIIQDGMRTG
jgi:hypothetical protein